MVKSYTDTSKQYIVVVSPRKSKFTKIKTPFKCFDYVCNCDGRKLSKFFSWFTSLTELYWMNIFICISLANTTLWNYLILFSFFQFYRSVKSRSLAILKWSSSKGLGHMCLQMNCLWKSWITLFATKSPFSSMYTNMLLHIATYYKSSSTILAGIWFSFNVIFLLHLSLMFF